MKFKRILTAVLAVLMLATCMSFTAGAVNPAVVYVKMGGGGDGTSPESPLGSFAAAYDAVKTSGGTIYLVDNAYFENITMGTGDVTVSSASGLVDGSGRPLTARLVLYNAGTYSITDTADSGTLKFENIGIYAATGDQRSWLAFGGAKVEFGEGVFFPNENANQKRPTFVGGTYALNGVASSRMKFASGEGTIYLSNQYLSNAGNARNVNLEILGGEYDVVVGFDSNHSANVHMQVNILADVPLNSVTKKNITSINRGINFIGNNGVTVDFASLGITTSGNSHYIYSGNGGRVDFIYTTSSSDDTDADKGYTAISGKYTISSNKQKALVKYPDGTFKIITLTANTTPGAEYAYTGTLAKENGTALDAGTYYVTYSNNPVVLNFYENKSDSDTAVAPVVVESTATNISSVVTTPTNTGYTFGGWYTNKECTGEAIDLANFNYAAGTSYYAKWLAQVDVSFDAQNGSSVATYTIDEDDTDISDLFTAPEKAASRLIGWNTKADGTGAYIDLANFAYNSQTTTYYAIWLSTTVYVDATASTNGNGEEATPYNNFADAWNALANYDGKIILKSNAEVSSLGAITKNITVTAASSSTVLDLAPGGSIALIDKGSTGKVTFENITLKADTNEQITFEGLKYEMGEGVATTGTKKPSLRAISVQSTRVNYGNYRTIIRSGDFSLIAIGGGSAWNTAAGTNMNLTMYGGSVGSITAGFTRYHSAAQIGNINIQLDVQPKDKNIISDYIYSLGAYQLIANNGVKVTPIIKKYSSGTDSGTVYEPDSMYVIYSAEGGRVDLIYETPDATTAKKGEYTITSDKKYAIITNLDTGDATQKDLTVAGGTTLTLDPGTYNIGYANVPASLNFYPNDGTADKTIVIIEQTATDISGSVVTPSLSGSRFLGWNTEADGSGEWLDLTNYAYDESATDFYAQWGTFIAYVKDGAAVNGVGTEELPYNNFTDAWNALKDSEEDGKTIILCSNATIDGKPDNTKGTITITSVEGKHYTLMFNKSGFNPANGNRGKIVFDDININASFDESIDFGGMAYEFTENVTTNTAKKPSLRSATTEQNFGDNILIIRNGDFNVIHLANKYSTAVDNSPNNGNINFEFRGGSIASLNVGYEGTRWSNVLKNVNILLDEAPASITGKNIADMTGVYQFIANNGVTTKPPMTNRDGNPLLPENKKYIIYSAEGGRVDFIYEDPTTAKIGEFKITTEYEYVVVNGTPYATAGLNGVLTLTPGTYNIRYEGEINIPTGPVDIQQNASSVISLLFGKYAVTFDTDGGSTVAPQYVTLGSKVTKPANDPVKAGYTFDGWYTSADFFKKFTFASTKVTGNTTIYAKWIKNDDPAKLIVLTIDSTDATVFGNKVANDVAPIIRNDRTMLPARFVAEALGATVEWTEWQRKVVITSADKQTIITIFIDSATAYVNGVAYTLDAPAFIENSRTYTPVRFVAEALGASVEWNAETREVSIYKK